MWNALLSKLIYNGSAKFRNFNDLKPRNNAKEITKIR